MVESTALTRAPAPDAFVLSVTLRNRSRDRADAALDRPHASPTPTAAWSRGASLAPRDFRAAEVIAAARRNRACRRCSTPATSSVVGYTVEIFYP